MTPSEQESILAIALIAAFADGSKDEAEHAAIRGILRDFQLDSARMAGLYQGVIANETSVAGAAAGLASPEARDLAYEIARCLCEANGPVVPAEQAVLDQLKAALGMASLAPAPPPSAATPDDLEPLLIRYAVLTAALELLPQMAGSLAIVPTQMKMVHDIGQRHGVSLDRTSLQDFAATLGIGAVSQVLEAGLRRLFSGVVGSVAGKTGQVAAEITGGVAGTALTFATTYALGKVADRYYAEGRKMDLSIFKAEFTSLVEKAKSLQTQYGTAIAAKAGELAEKFKGMDVSTVLGNILQGKAI